MTDRFIPRLGRYGSALLAISTALLFSASVQAQEVVVAGYGGTTPANAKSEILDPFRAESGVSSSWDVIPGGIVAGVQAQQQTGNVQWDVGFHLQGSDVEQLARLGYLEQLPAEVVAQNKAEGLNDATEFYVPNGYGASIIVCNPKHVEKCPSTPAEFFDLKNFPGSRMLSSFQPISALAFAAQAAGASYDAVYPIDLDKATAKLQELKPGIRVFYNSGTQARQLLSSGEIPIALFWAGNTQRLAAETAGEIDWHVSWEGGVKFGLYRAVFKNAPNTENAIALFRWMQAHPEALANFAKAEGSSPASPASLALMPEQSRPWMPGAGDNTRLTFENNVWYMENKQAVDEFWKIFISG